MNSIAVRRPWEAAQGDVIIVHPERPETIRATVTGRPWSDGWYTRIPYRTDDGIEAVFELQPKNAIVVEIEAEVLLTDAERDEEFARLSEDDCGLIAAFVADQRRDVFDQALRRLKTFPGRLEVASR